MSIPTEIPPKQMYKTFVFDSDKIFPKILPEAFQSIEVVEGDGGPGTIKEITFGKDGHFKNAKYRVDALDEENLTYSYSWIEGDTVNISYNIKIEAGPNGWSICKSRSNYNAIGDIQFTEEQIDEGNKKVLGLFKALEKYLLANSNAC